MTGTPIAMVSSIGSRSETSVPSPQHERPVALPAQEVFELAAILRIHRRRACRPVERAPELPTLLARAGMAAVRIARAPDLAIAAVRAVLDRERARHASCNRRALLIRGLARRSRGEQRPKHRQPENTEGASDRDSAPR